MHLRVSAREDRAVREGDVGRAGHHCVLDSVLKQFGTIQPLKGLGQGAWTLKNSDIVVRKDYKVLLVNVRGIPPPFGPSRMTRTDVALNVAAAIMSCWSGA